MKSLIRKIAVYSLSLFILTLVVNGARISDGASGIVICGIVFTMLSILLSPIIKIIGFPVRMLSFGFFPLFINAVLLFVLTIFVSNFTITAFFFPGVTIAGFVIPRVFFNSFLAFLASSLVFSTSVFLINWVTNK